MLTYSFEAKTEQPLYEQLYSFIKEDILSGKLKTGDRLPSKRPFAEQLSISTITVENAYAQLATEGYIKSEPRRGFFVADVGNLKVYAGRKRAGGVDRRTDAGKENVGRKSAGRKQNGTESARAGREWFADFASNQTSAEHFPFATWARLSRRILSDKQEELLVNTPGGGSLELRAAIADYLGQFRGLEVAPEQVLVGAGTEYLYGLLLQLLGMDATYATENPGYRKATQIFESYGVRHIGVMMDGDGIVPEEIRKAQAQVVHVTPSHHFPTGITMPVSRRGQLLDWANEAPERYIIEDDYDSEFRLSGRILQPLAAMDNTGRVIYMNTFTKTLASTIRVSYMVLPPKLMERFREKLNFYSCTVSTFEQYTLAAFIREGHFEKHINRMRTMSRRKRDSLLRAFDIYGNRSVDKKTAGEKKRIFISEEDAGLHFLMNIALDMSGEEFRKRLNAAGIRMMDLTWYLQTEAETGETAKDAELTPFRVQKLGDGRADHTFIVNYSHVPEERIGEAVERILRAAEIVRA